MNRKITLLVVALLGIEMSVQGQVSAVTKFSIQPIFGNTVVPGRILPLRISLVTRRALRARCEAYLTPGRSRTVQLYDVGKGRFEFELFVRIPLVHANTQARVMVELTSEHERWRRFCTVMLVDMRYFNDLVAWVTPRGCPPARLPPLFLQIPRYGFTSITQFCGVKLQDLPRQWESYLALDQVLLADVDLSRLSQDQCQALCTWLHAGGRLIISGTCHSSLAAVDPLLKALGVRLDDRPRVFTVGRPWFQKSLQLKGRRIFDGGQIVSDAAHLMVQRNSQLGQLTLCCLDLQQNVLLKQTDEVLKDFFLHLLYQQALPNKLEAYKIGQNNYPHYHYWIYLLTQIIALEDISRTAILWGLFVFCCLVIPVDYLLLKRYQALHYTWLTTTVVTLCVCWSAARVSYLTRGSDDRLASLNVHDYPQPEGGLCRHTSLAVFVPSQRYVYKVTFPESGIVFDSGNQQIRFGPQKQQVELAAPVWSFRPLAGVVLEKHAILNLNYDLYLDEHRALAGTVEIQVDELEDAFLLFRGQIYHLLQQQNHWRVGPALKLLPKLPQPRAIYGSYTYRLSPQRARRYLLQGLMLPFSYTTQCWNYLIRRPLGAQQALLVGITSQGVQFEFATAPCVDDLHVIRVPLAVRSGQ